MVPLNNDTVHMLPQAGIPVVPHLSKGESHILHFGVGAFHRSHQAFAWHQLHHKYPARYGDWSVVGVCLMPGDKPLVDRLRAQDGLYALRMSPAVGTEQVVVINSIKRILYGPDDADLIIDRIASADTYVISFTITEGGYQASAQEHLQPGQAPTTVYGYLARGLAERRKRGSGSIVLMSCDNIQENGHVLRSTLLSFLEAHDPDLKNWVITHAVFPNSMVDRITPATTAADKDAFAARYGLRDEALVVSEDFFQWVLEREGLEHLPPLSEVGVQLVDDVRPYEAMKLSVLNAGHSLVGLLGEALGYNTIHEAVADARISALFDAYALDEAIPVLQLLDGVDYAAYYRAVKMRFGNAMINDSTARIIGGSSDKIPKFLLPVVNQQLQSDSPRVAAAALVVAAWWYYLRNAYRRDRMDSVVDNQLDALRECFADEAASPQRFLQLEPIFGGLAADPRFREPYAAYAARFADGGASELVQAVSMKDDNE